MTDQPTLGPGKSPHSVRLLYAAPFDLDLAAIAGEIECELSAPDANGVVVVRFPEDLVEIDGTSRPASLMVSTGPAPKLSPEDVRQSWAWSEARNVVFNAPFSVLVTEVTTLLLDANRRSECLTDFISAVLVSTERGGRAHSSSTRFLLEKRQKNSAWFRPVKMRTDFLLLVGIQIR